MIWFDLINCHPANQSISNCVTLSVAEKHLIDENLYSSWVVDNALCENKRSSIDQVSFVRFYLCFLFFGAAGSNFFSCCLDWHEQLSLNASVSYDVLNRICFIFLAIFGRGGAAFVMKIFIGILLQTSSWALQVFRLIELNALHILLIELSLYLDRV